MYRAVVAVIVGGFALGGIGIGSGLGQQPGAIGAGLIVDTRPTVTSADLTVAVAPVRKTKKTLKASQAAKTVTKIVRYDGFEVSVPAGWPVYWLNQDPGQCVRYDTNAV
jgi:hypothetical protein